WASGKEFRQTPLLVLEEQRTPAPRGPPAYRYGDEFDARLALLARAATPFEGEPPGRGGSLRETDSCNGVARIERGIWRGLYPPFALSFHPVLSAFPRRGNCVGAVDTIELQSLHGDSPIRLP